MQDHLLREAKKRALYEQKSLTAFIEEAVREKLNYSAGRSTPKATEHFELLTFRGEGTLPGVDLDNSAALRDLMDY
jgi:hypothetical protein